jgi:hypothetical protein
MYNNKITTDDLPLTYGKINEEEHVIDIEINDGDTSEQQQKDKRKILMLLICVTTILTILVIIVATISTDGFF